MSRKIILKFILFSLLVVVQIPLLHNWVLYEVAFPFPYIGVILLLPPTLQRGWLMLLAFFLGLTIDAFFNTPGIHSSASVLIAFIRMSWLGTTTNNSSKELELPLSYLGFIRFTMFIFPLVLIHHFIIFTLENEGFKWMGSLVSRVIWSALFSYFLIWLMALIVLSSTRRK